MVQQRPLDTLQRLRRQAVDEERRALAAAHEEVDAVEASLASLRAGRSAELARPGDHADLLARYLERMRQREAVLSEALEDALRTREERTARLHEARLRMRQLERLAELRQLRATVEAGRKERRSVDDLTLIRRAGRAIDGA